MLCQPCGLSKRTMEIWKKIGPYCQRQTCSPLWVWQTERQNCNACLYNDAYLCNVPRGGPWLIEMIIAGLRWCIRCSVTCVQTNPLYGLRPGSDRTNGIAQHCTAAISIYRRRPLATGKALKHVYLLQDNVLPFPFRLHTTLRWIYVVAYQQQSLSASTI